MKTPMTIHVPEEYQTRREAYPPFEMNIVSYRLGRTYICTVDNVDPGAVIARAKGATRQEAEEAAIGQAKRRLDRSRTY